MMTTTTTTTIEKPKYSTTRRKEVKKKVSPLLFMVVSLVVVSCQISDKSVVYAFQSGPIRRADFVTFPQSLASNSAPLRRKSTSNVDFGPSPRRPQRSSARSHNRRMAQISSNRSLARSQRMMEDDDSHSALRMESTNNNLLVEVESLQPPTTTTTTMTNANVMVRFWQKIKSASQVDKQAMAKLGIAFGLTYNIISNINGSISLSLAWYIASKKTGLSPLAPGQWKALLAAYGTLYMLICLLRPLRLALAVALTRKMEDFLQYLQDRLGCSRAVAIGVMVSLGLVLWGSLCAIGVSLASAAAGVPIWKTAY